MKKIILSAALFSLSISCFSQTTSERRENEGVCYQALMEKAKRAGIDSIDSGVIKNFLMPNFDAANRVTALSTPGGKCVGASNDCFKRNLSQSDYNFGIGMLKTMALFESTQDPNQVRNILAVCSLIKR